MSQSKKDKKRIVTTTPKDKKTTTSYRNKHPRLKIDNELPFGKKNFTYMLGGFATMLLGMALMVGGHMPSPEVWDPNLIYGFRQTVLAPFVILTGIGIIIYGIFKKK